MRAAFKTVTGEYLQPSEIIGAMFNRPFIEGINPPEVHVTLYTSVGALTLDDIVPDEWKELISAVSIFISAPEEVKSGGVYENPENARVMFKLFDLDANTFGISIGTYFETPVPEKDVLVTRETLPVIDSVQYTGDVNYTYNSRLFTGNIIEILPDGYNSDYKQNPMGDVNYEYFFKIQLKTAEGYSEVLTKKSPISTTLARSEYNYVLDMMFETMTGGNFINLPVFLTYPDSRACKISLYVKEASDQSNKAWLQFEKDMISAPGQNVSFAENHLSFEPDFGIQGRQFVFPNRIVGYNAPDRFYSPKYFNNSSLFNFEIDISGEKQAVFSSNTILHTPNKVKASALAMPMSYPVDHTYTVGNREVVGISANNLSIDSSSFGVFPLFVFTKDGVYAMKLGYGDALIESISPLSGDICIDKKSVVNIGGATVFASMDGLHMLHGQRSTNITEHLNDYTVNPLAGNRHFNAILEKYSLQDYISTADINEYLTGSKSYLNYRENELVITNENYPYSYVFSFKTNQLSKLSERYYHVINDYPRAYGTNNGTIYDISEDVPTDSNRNIMLQTNAFKLGVNEFERIHRLIARMKVTGSDRIGVYLFVSNDTRKWAIADGLEKTGSATDFSYLSCPNSVKYGMLVIAGTINMLHDFISHISIEFITRYENKIR
jgi:hypothetical protein